MAPGVVSTIATLLHSPQYRIGLSTSVDRLRKVAPLLRSIVLSRTPLGRTYAPPSSGTSPQRHGRHASPAGQVLAASCGTSMVRPHRALPHACAPTGGPRCLAFACRPWSFRAARGALVQSFAVLLPHRTWNTCSSNGNAEPCPSSCFAQTWRAAVVRGPTPY